MVMAIGKADIHVCRNRKKKTLGNFRLIDFSPIHWEMIEEILQKRTLKVVKDKKMIMSSQHGFTK